MTQLEAIKKMLEKVEAGVRISYDDTDPIASKIYPGCTLEDAGRFYKAVQGESVDAVITLMKAVLPDKGWSVGGHSSLEAYYVGWSGRHKAYANTPARALLIATLKALIAQEKALTELAQTDQEEGLI